MTWKIHDPQNDKYVQAETLAEAEHKLIEFWEEQ